MVDAREGDATVLMERTEEFANAAAMGMTKRSTTVVARMRGTLVGMLAEHLAVASEL